MTACLAEDSERDAGVLQEHLYMARGTDICMFWINVNCDQQILEMRIQSPERCQGAKTKLTDTGVLRNLLSDHRLIKTRTTEKPNGLCVGTLDVSGHVEQSVSVLMSMISEEANDE